MIGLSELIAPCSKEKFLGSIWTKEKLHVSHGEHAFSSILNWEMLNELLEHHIHSLPPSQLNLSKNGKAIPVQDLLLESSGKRTRRLSTQKINTHCQSGATLILNGAQTLFVSLKSLSHGLHLELNERNQINIYVSHTAQLGFNRHFDTHEVLVLQIEGSKEWEIYDQRPNNFPSQGHHDRFQNHASEPVFLTMNKGDVLYIPRGMYHAAKAVHEPSLHLTIGIRCRTRLDFLQWAVSRLGSSKDVRQNMPLMFDDEKIDQEEIAELQKTLVSGVTELLKDESLLVEYQHYCEQLVGRDAYFHFPLDRNPEGQDSAGQ